MTHETPISAHLVSGQPHSGEKLGAAYVARLREQFPTAILDEEWQTPDQLTITIKLNSLPDVVEYLYYQQGGWLSVLFGNDERSLNGYFAIYYVLSMEGREQYGIDTGKKYGDKCWVIVKALISPERPEFPSVTPRVPAAVWGEREVRDMYGLQPIGLPDERRLVLPDDWPMEKLAETRMGYNDVTFLSDRICGICGFTHSVAYTSSIENALGIIVPPRAQMIRTILLEVERLHSHLLNIGLSCHFVGFDTGFMQFFRVREKAMTIAEMLTGARKTYGLNLIGGVRRDILKADRIKTLQLVSEMRADISELVDMLMSTANIEQRTMGVGMLDRKIARDFSPVGPMIRASGYARDMRHDHPYANYANIPKELFSLDGCDVHSRLLVRVREFFDSLVMIEYGLNHMPDGPLLEEKVHYQPYKFALGFSEAPRGEDVHWSMTGDNQKLFRWRCRAATYANWPVLRYMLRGNTVSDAPLIIGSLDPCYSCTDRVTLVDVRKQKSVTVPYKEIERYGIERTHSPLK
ncbi:hydrogenase large subunit [Yersinia enterocolitica]|uniref:hydrogenase large subunit n=1 Tax=Yersinia enterocolitica TaxID=630 RepID=UPI00338FB6BB